ncbi:WbqC family protein [Campylobacter sp. LMG 7929]|uniref:WbqC family protein n=1 Tax=unclassified Campylobacter TaxID=2593542 RepID=UPI0021E66287|nr:WbqC family protein [Campylobacter sp. CNRCH_2015_0338h]MCR8698185.1 WbqC family protein [Campylobacter sp. LMG 7929]HEC1728307.1 WbqC family protein [Campylobacter lari]MCV3471934.1 WbqC family protein [Campylobacter sp. CNRCH_2015_0338h]HEC1764611.1 WbqC family protein [Campylobacter lari]HEC1790404.1 WbqC family protein [Campylobacter lari]
MKIAIMQPTFNPWLGYMYMIQSVDTFVFLDNVQFERRSWQNRNKIKLQDKTFLLGLNLQKAPQKTSLQDILFEKDDKWKIKFLKTIHHAYSKSINFNKYYNILEKALFKHTHLAQFNMELIKIYCEHLNIKTPILQASSLNLKNEKKEKLLLEICQTLKADHYLSPEGSKNYLEKEAAKEIFKNANIKIEYFDFIHPTYTQLGVNFIAYLGILDFLFNEKEPCIKFQECVKINECNNESSF